MGPYTVANPKIHDKMYRWCSCGQSLNQPFCDESHQGTAFKPYKFTI
jgi:CDGSH-type Zn-finger protein